MAGEPLTAEAIALTEKKMDMALDDIIKMSKTNLSKAKRQRKVPRKNQKFTNNFTQDKSTKLKNFMDSRSSLRQGVLSRRRSSFQEKQFPVTAEFAHKAVVSPLLKGASYRSRFSRWSRSSNGTPLSQGQPSSGDFVAKLSLPSSKKMLQESNVVSKQKPQTLDSLFADMKEQRMRILSRQNPVQRNGAVFRRPPWSRDRFGN